MKQYMVVSCPIDTYSGYGARARDFVKALYELKANDWQIEIIPQRWGNTPWGYIEEHKEEWGFLLPLLNKTGQLIKQPDVWCQITVPNEFQTMGKYNLGVTAGIETTLCDPSWLQGCNRMDLTLVSSEHAKNVFQNSKFDEVDQQTGKLIQKIELKKPIDVIFEGFDPKKYFYKSDDDIEATDLVDELDGIEEDFCFLFVGHWLPGEVGEDRKNVGLTIKTFLETFKDKKYVKKPALVLKVSGGIPGILDRDELLNKIEAIRSQISGKNLPNIYLLNGDVKDEDMNDLYNHPKVKAMISFTKGEGFGRPLLEFTQSKKPIAVSYWSGHVDFLDSEFVYPVIGELKQIHPSAVAQNMLIPESLWFSPNRESMIHSMTSLFNNYDTFLEKAKRQARKSITEYSFNNMKDVLAKYLERVPQQVPIQLPKFASLPKLKKIEK
jgi:hypothetical protein